MTAAINTNSTPTPMTWDFESDAAVEVGLKSANDAQPFLHSANDGNANLNTANQ
jgi:hypothetical protein